VGVLFTTGAGEYWLTLVDTYGATGLTLIAFIEVIIVMYVYGHEKFTEVNIGMLTYVNYFLGLCARRYTKFFIS
jgi:hypothetical protein